MIRVDREGLNRFYQAEGIGSTGSGVPIVDDGVNAPPWEQKPWASLRENIASETLRLMEMTPEECQAIRPPTPQYLFPPDVEYDRNPMTIMEVLDTDRWAPRQVSWVSPTLRPVTRQQYEDDRWQGSARNISVSSSPLG